MTKNLPAAPKPSESQKNIEPKRQNPWTPEEKASLAIVIGRVFDLQKQFGKTTGQVENIVEGFLWAMSAYPLETVISGFQKYILRRSDMPTPSDIVQIIDPPAKVWEPDKAYYISLKKILEAQGPYGLDTEETEYLRAYEEHARGEHRASIKR